MFCREAIDGATPDPGWIARPGLSVTVMMVMAMMTVMTAGCKGRARAYQHQEGEDDQLLHEVKRSTVWMRMTLQDCSGIKRAIILLGHGAGALFMRGIFKGGAVRFSKRRWQALGGMAAPFPSQD